MMDLTQLGLAFPLVQAPMAGVQDSALTIAVTEAGGLGSLPCAMLSAEQLDTALRQIRQHTQGPYNVNFFCHTPPEYDVERDLLWRAALKPYYERFGLTLPTSTSQPSRQPFNDAMAEVLEAHKPAVVSFHFGLPAPALLKRVQRLGAHIWSSATTLDEALWLEKQGIDVIIAQGLEAGGHRGMFLSTDLKTQQRRMPLLRDVLANVKVPVVAAGGIATPEDVTEVMAAGAAGVQVGTAYLRSHEATTSPLHRAALSGSAAQMTALTNLYSGRPARGLVTELMNDLGAMSAIVPPFPLASNALAPLRQAAEVQGVADFSPLWAGERAPECREASAAKITAFLAQGFVV